MSTCYYSVISFWIRVAYKIVNHPSPLPCTAHLQVRLATLSGVHGETERECCWFWCASSFNAPASGMITELPGAQVQFLEPKRPLGNCKATKENRASSLRPHHLCGDTAPPIFSPFWCDESKSLFGLTVAFKLGYLWAVVLPMLCVPCGTTEISASQFLALTVAWDKH